MKTHKKNIFTYSDIAKLLNTTEEAIRQANHRGHFNFDNKESIIHYISAHFHLQKAKEQKK